MAGGARLLVMQDAAMVDAAGTEPWESVAARRRVGARDERREIMVLVRR